LREFQFEWKAFWEWASSSRAKILIHSADLRFSF
jgi:hypothetical protein